MLWWTKRTLRYSKDASKRCAAVRALSRFRSSEVTKLLANALRDTDLTVRLLAAEQLAIRQDRRGIDELVQALIERCGHGTKQIAETLSHVGWTPTTQRDRVFFAIANLQFEEAASEGAVAVAPLAMVARLACDPRARGRYDGNGILHSVQHALEAITDPAACEALMQVAVTTYLPEEFRTTVIAVVGRIGDRSIAPKLERLLSDTRLPEDKIMARAAAQALGQIGAVDSSPRLLEIFTRDRSSSLEDAAAEALGLLGCQEAVPILIKMALQERGPAITALGRLRNPSSWAAFRVLACTDDPRSSPHRIAAQQALESIDFVALPSSDSVWELRRTSSERVVVGIVEVLAEINDEHSFELLTLALEDGAGQPRAAFHLAKLDPHRAYGVLLKHFLYGRNGSVYAALAALVTLHDVRTPKALVLALWHWERYKAKLAEDALNKNFPGWETSEDALSALPELETALSSGASGERISAALALATIRPDRST